jgi:hypothetical protein
MTWKIRIAGNQHDIEELKRSFSGVSISVTKGNDGDYLEHEQFAACKTADEVLQISSKVLAILNGATRLALGGNSVITESGVLQEREDGTSQFYMHVSETINVRDSFSITVMDSDGNVVEEIHPADEVPVWVSLGLKDEAVEKVFRLFGLQHDWVGLYRIYEVIEHDAGGIDAIANNDWARKSSLKLFKHTANSPGAIGDDARHGKEASAPPPKPMLLSEGRALIETLVHYWLRAKQSA